MRNFFSSLFEHESLRAFRQRIFTLLAPLRAVWSQVADALQPVLGPLGAGWSRLTDPLRQRWAQFAGRYPRLATAAGWVAAPLRWGLYFLLLLILSVWLGLWGTLPSSAEL
ncbi:MAG: hypothetical protein JNK89_10210, partial [Saprospiraceae bacterium]|nr:hypothetical protein [Saprospiraceae bacterium]